MVNKISPSSPCNRQSFGPHSWSSLICQTSIFSETNLKIYQTQRRYFLSQSKTLCVTFLPIWKQRWTSTPRVKLFISMIHYTILLLGREPTGQLCCWQTSATHKFFWPFQWERIKILCVIGELLQTATLPPAATIIHVCIIKPSQYKERQMNNGQLFQSYTLTAHFT